MSDRFVLVEPDAAPEYSTSLDELDRANWAPDLEERRLVVGALHSGGTPRNVEIPNDLCIILTLDYPIPQQDWIQSKSAPPETESLTSEHRALFVTGSSAYPESLNWALTPRTRSLTQQFAAALKAHDTEAALDALFDAVDTALLAGRFRECDRALASVHVSEWPTDLLIGLLSITLAASHKLPARAAIVERTRRVLTERGDDTVGLLNGLE